MAGLMVYFPGQGNGPSITDEMLREIVRSYELEQLLGKGPYQAQPVNVGPDKSSVGGIVLAVDVRRIKEHPGRNPNTGYLPEDQEWHEVPIRVRQPGYWLGWKKSDPVRPEDLQRTTKLLKDYEVVLGDGNTWAVMALTPFERPGVIPRVWTMGDDGEGIWPPKEGYSGVIAIYEKLWAGESLLQNDWAKLVVDTLAINYFLNAPATMFLGLLTTDLCHEVISLAMDMPEVQKKTPSDTSASSSGVENPVASLT